MPDTERISATEAALSELAALRDRHGPLVIHQSGGCCDGSSPLCLHEGELLLAPGDRLLGELGGVPMYIDGELDDRWNRPTFILDLSPGRTDLFSLEVEDGVHFVTRSPSCGVPGGGPAPLRRPA